MFVRHEGKATLGEHARAAQFAEWPEELAHLAQPAAASHTTAYHGTLHGWEARTHAADSRPAAGGWPEAAHAKSEH